MKQCIDCSKANLPAHENDDRPREEWSCNWLDWMVEDANGVCPHCGGPVIEIPTVTPLGRLMDNLGKEQR